MFAPQVMSPAPLPNQQMSPYMPQSPMMMDMPIQTGQQDISGVRRSNSFSWRAEAGLPPPPSEIDQFPEIQRHMIPQNGIQSSTDAMPMHAVTKHPKLKLRILLAKSIFEAGETVSGMLEITSSTSQRLRLGEIAVELEAFEELSSRDHSATQIFLFNRTLFQGEHLPPSNAVLPAAPVQGHWTARKGRTTFPFSFRLPITAPSSIVFGGNATLRYSLKGTVQTWWNETKSLVTVRSEASVVERWEDEFDPRYVEPVEVIADTHVFMGGNGAVWLEASIGEQLFASGNMIMIRAGIKNNSKRQMSGMKVTLVRRLIFPVSGPPGKPAAKPNLEPQVTEEVHSQLFKGPSYEFPPNEEVVVNLAVDIPRELRTIRKTRLFEVHTLAIVSLQMGSFAKDLHVEIPVYVAHPNSLQGPVARPVQKLQDLPQRSRSAMAQHGQHQFHQPFQQSAQAMPNQIASPMIPDHRGWSPAPPPSRPASAAAAMGNGMPYASPTTPQPFAFVPAGHGQGQQIVWNADAQAWTANALLASIAPPVRPASAQELPMRSQSVAAPEMMQNVARGQQQRPQSTNPQQNSRRYSAPSPDTGRQQQQQHPVQVAQRQQPPQQQQQQKPRSALLPSPTVQAIHNEPPAPQKQEVQPDHHEQQPLQVPFVPSPSQLLGANAQPLGLATIEEDSESAAGTVKSIRTLIGSVSRGDIDQFEQMAQRAEDEEEMRKAMGEMGMVPDERQFVVSNRQESVQEYAKLPQRAKAQPPQSPQAKEKTLPEAPAQKSSKAESKTSSRPKAADIFRAPANEPTEQQKPVRPSSAQGVGLLALESRLNTPTPSQVVSSKKIPAARKSEPSPSRLSPRKADTAEREQRAREDEELRKKHEEQRKADEERKKARQSALLAAAAANSKPKIEQHKPTSQTLSSTSTEKKQGERKAVDVGEQRQLNKDAVGRVAGWLSTSPSREIGLATPTKQNEQAVDPTLSPKTPSPSVLMGNDDTLSDRKAGHKTEGGSSLALHALFDRQDQSDIVSRLSQPSKEQVKPRSHVNASTSKVASKAVEKPSSVQEDVADINIPAAFSKTLMKNDQLEPTPSSVRYDVRSARGGRGGRVASVASMWASIAEGTDGSEGKDPTPVLTLKPKAVRSGAGSKLDFTKTEKVEGKTQKKDIVDVVQKPTVQKLTIQTRQPLIVKNRVMSPTAKTSGAPHFVNTTIPRAVFTASDPSPKNADGAAKENIAVTKADLPPAVRKLSLEGGDMKQQQQQPAEGKLKATRKITSDLIAAEARMRAGRDLAKDAEDALTPMNGRGTTKAIGRERLADLRSLWGN
ncbi:uncharacterized protein FA14DRAFT_54751 [Meira miltonrushii]|uniref:Arrestin C-terminal-like domain-containing protein n=1 Tax=Meira miltonrushii TaxID=1280837 RepID=A0A316VGI3_9BASI|nr:uncharacterized protein FA14DRAFT_54751 [Meira miltonrushii]PWN36394.1 hypothetical protein FA14DRAFT_54751 [Meira miltonrushii]